MEDPLARTSDGPRRGSDPPRAVRVGPGVVRLLNSDTTWADNLVERIFRMDAKADACWVREHTLDSHIDLRTPDTATTLRAAKELLEELAAVRSNDGVVHLRDTTRSFAVLVRRALMTRIKVLALAEATIEENTSGTIDEVVAHRLGQLALIGDAEEATGSIKVDGRPVFGRDITFPCATRVTEFDQNVVLVYLRHGERFAAEVRARRGVALEHVKFSAVATVAVWAKQVLEIAPDPTVRFALEEAGFTIKPDLEVQRSDGLHMRSERAAEVAKEHDTVLKFKVPTCFSLPLEPLGQLNAEACVNAAVATVSAEVEEFCVILTAP